MPVRSLCLPTLSSPSGLDARFGYPIFPIIFSLKRDTFPLNSSWTTCIKVPCTSHIFAHRSQTRLSLGKQTDGARARSAIS
ncbi:hypothetical protein K523DRAFT_419040 [Schizophyllum commune Tattone D]|nr:hypothetical protein K523DRAFT_419040 [Schizophyllum commune Tattone D]